MAQRSNGLENICDLVYNNNQQKLLNTKKKAKENAKENVDYVVKKITKYLLV